MDDYLPSPLTRELYSGKVDEACQELERLLKVQPANRNARLSLIQYYLDNGQEPKAQVLLQGWKKMNRGGSGVEVIWSTSLRSTPSPQPSPHGGEGKGSRSSSLSKPEIDSKFQVDITRKNSSASPLYPLGRSDVSGGLG